MGVRKATATLSLSPRTNRNYIPISVNMRSGAVSSVKFPTNDDTLSLSRHPNSKRPANVIIKSQEALFPYGSKGNRNAHRANAP